MGTETNVNLNNKISTGNTGLIKTSAKLGIVAAYVLVPKGTTIAASNMVNATTFATYVNGLMNGSGSGANTRANRWFPLVLIDKFTNSTKKTANEDTGRFQFDIFNFPARHEVRYMTNICNFIELTNFNGAEYGYDAFIVDTNGIWWGTYDTTGAGGLSAFTLAQIFVPNWDPKTVSTDSAFMLNLQFASTTQWNSGFKYYQANTFADALVGLENVILQDAPSNVYSALSAAATTDMVVIGKMGQDSADFFGVFGSQLTKACFAASDLTVPATLTISSMTFGVVVVSGVPYYYGWAVLSAPVTSTHKVQLTLATPSAVNIIIPNANVVCEVWNPGIDGQNAAVHTF